MGSKGGSKGEFSKGRLQKGGSEVVVLQGMVLKEGFQQGSTGVIKVFVRRSQKGFQGFQKGSGGFEKIFKRNCKLFEEVHYMV